MLNSMLLGKRKKKHKTFEKSPSQVTGMMWELLQEMDLKGMLLPEM